LDARAAPGREVDLQIEPTKHQYDHDVETVYSFLLANGLEKEVKLNIEANHATLAGQVF